MEKNQKKENGRRKAKKENLFSKIGAFLSESSKNAERATIVLFILILLSIISSIFVYYLYTPAKEIYTSETQLTKEIRSIYDFEINSEERTSQETRAKEAQELYGTIRDKYASDSNALIKGYASIHSIFFKVLIAIAIILPYASIALMFIGSPINFIFAVLNMVFVVPFKTAKYLFNSFRVEKKNQRAFSSKAIELKAAN